jgi:hypothetical protein
VDRVHEMSKWPREQLVSRMEYLQHMGEVAQSRAVAVNSEAVKTLVAELEARLGYVRASYLGIDTAGFPNVVMSSLASLQGQEREIHVQIEMWKNARDAKKRLDDEMHLCEKAIMDKDGRVT